ncbi:MAG: polysaccharide biosynthesis protein [Flavobacteriales bacterium]|nr:polysaccharide biosynthesis protein [Flavobacteriales bacterium]
MASRRFPRWGILVIDLVQCLIALAAAYLLRFNFQVPPHEVDLLLPVLPLFLAIRLGSFLLAGTHRGMVRHTNTDDARVIFLTVLGGSLAFGIASLVRFHFIDGLYFLPRAVIVIDFLATAMLLIGSRIAFKLRHLRERGAGKEQVRVIIHGAGEAGLIVKRTLEREGSARYTVAAFVDDDPAKAGKRLEGVAVYHTKRLADLLRGRAVDQVIIAIADPDPEHRRHVVDRCMEARVKVLTIPPVRSWIGGQLSAGQIQAVRIEDLLGRPVIELDQQAVRAMLAGQRVLVTGAAGSIGAELARQLHRSGAAELTLVDIAESGLYDLEMELRGQPGAMLHVRVGDVRDEARMERLMREHRPQVIFHAAAYKHVPLMEAHPAEAVSTNVGGTRVMARLACAHGVGKFMLISTDKAVNPTSVMGASKRVAELLVHAMPEGCATSFITTRFGNVLGSSGSVIPLFRRQIEQGGPVTVTHPEVDRFFMTIPEACRLVLEAAAMGRGGEIYVFDMGQPVRIADLAEKMIRLSGLEPGSDIAITYTGLRPGEKLFEELLATAENTLPTHHPRILIGKALPPDPQRLPAEVEELLTAAREGRTDELPRLLKRSVPEYTGATTPVDSFEAPPQEGATRI